MQVQLVGSGLGEVTDDQWRDRVRQAFALTAESGPELDGIVEATRNVQADATAAADLERLLNSCSSPIVLYFALPPAVTQQACRALAELELPSSTRLVLEKPFGNDAASAEELNRALTRLVPEDQIFRVDHYLGMSTVLNLFGIPFTNRFLESVLAAAPSRTSWALMLLGGSIAKNASTCRA